MQKKIQLELVTKENNKQQLHYKNIKLFNLQLDKIQNNQEYLRINKIVDKRYLNSHQVKNRQKKNNQTFKINKDNHNYYKIKNQKKDNKTFKINKDNQYYNKIKKMYNNRKLYNKTNRDNL